MTGYTFSANATGGIFATSNLGVISTNNPVDFTFTFTGVLPTAVGGLFFLADSYFNLVPSGVQISLSDGTVIILPFGGFAGFTSDVGITSLTVGGPFSGQPPGTNFVTVNSLYVGTGSTASVPEPSSFALISVIGLLGLVYRKRMKK